MPPPEVPTPLSNLAQVALKKDYLGLILVIGVTILLIIGAGFFLNQITEPPTNFPLNTEIVIAKGSNAKSVAKQMKEAGYVRSELMLYLSFVYWHDPSDIKASTYVFVEPLTTRALARELTTGHFGNDLIKLTLIEGDRITMMAKRAAAVLPKFNIDTFIALSAGKEGRLFPDTYFVPATYTAEDLLSLLTSTYIEKTTPLRPQIEGSKITEDEILVLASIIEREANTKESMRLVSGILQERLRIGMALQVDASLEYVLDKPLSELTAEDLKLDSPYNTYLTSKLPPTPIGNPGLDAIMAVLEPEPSEYLFYITGNDGEFYYARNFTEHRRNIARHLH